MQPMLDHSSSPPRQLRRVPWLVTLALALVAVAPGAALAGTKKFYFELTAVKAKPEVKADVAKASVPRIEAAIRKVIETHPQLVAKLEGAPDKAQAEAYRKHLAQKGVTGAYLVTVEVTEASEELEAMDKPSSQRLTVALAVHVLGEIVPDRAIGFTGDGKAKVKQEIGKKLRPRDREVAWDQAAEVAIADAMESVFKQLEKPKKK
jgi:hypothetical protein